MTRRVHTQVQTAGSLYLAECPFGCPVGLLAVEAVADLPAARRALAEMTGWRLDQIHVTCLPRATVRPFYKELYDNRRGCPHPLLGTPA